MGNVGGAHADWCIVRLDGVGYMKWNDAFYKTIAEVDKCEKAGFALWCGQGRRRLSETMTIGCHDAATSFTLIKKWQVKRKL